LTRAGYDRVRVAEAEMLGIRIATLDKEVEALRPRIKDEAQGIDLDLYEPEPWAYPVDGAELLAKIATTVRTYAVVTIEQARTVALWIVASHAFAAFRIFPRLLIKAPNSECGKSTLKEIVGALVTKAFASDNASTAFIFRVIELRKPTTS
jgi:putative DNA primase/helicase